jgi:hypothetical protein
MAPYLLTCSICLAKAARCEKTLLQRVHSFFQRFWWQRLKGFFLITDVPEIQAKVFVTVTAKLLNVSLILAGKGQSLPKGAKTLSITIKNATPSIMTNSVMLRVVYAE